MTAPLSSRYSADDRKTAAEWLRDCAHDAGTSDRSVGIFSNEDLAALFRALATAVESDDYSALAPRSERPALYDKGDVAVAIDCLRWMALCGRVSPQDIAAACMGATTGKDWAAAMNRITDPFVPAEHRTTSNERDKP